MVRWAALNCSEDLLVHAEIRVSPRKTLLGVPLISQESWASAQTSKVRRSLFFYLKANNLASGNFFPNTAAVISLLASMEKVMPLPP